MPAAASPSAYPRHPTNANVTVGAARGGRILLPRPHVVDRPHRVEGAERGPDRPFETEWRSRLCAAPPAGNTRREHPAPCATGAGHSGMRDAVGTSGFRKRQWRPSEDGEWLYRLAERLFQPALFRIGGPFNCKGFPPSGERNSAELAVF